MSLSLLTSCGGGDSIGGVDAKIPEAESDNTTSDAETTIPNIAIDFENEIYQKIIVPQCIDCHVQGGIAGNTQLVFISETNNKSSSQVSSENQQRLNFFIGNDSAMVDYLMQKASGKIPHGGGVVIDSLSGDFIVLEEYLTAVATGTLMTENDSVNDDNEISDNDNINTVDETPIISQPEENILEMSFAEVNRQVIQPSCVACHSNTGIAQSTALLFTIGISQNAVNSNQQKIDSFTANIQQQEKLLNKARGFDNHGGGRVLASNSVPYLLLEGYLQASSNQETIADNNSIAASHYKLESASTTYRRASLILTGEIPKAQRLEEIDTMNNEQFANAIEALMVGEGFKKFLKNGANDRLLVRGLNQDSWLQVHDKWQHWYALYLDTHSEPSANNSSSQFYQQLASELAEAPLELINFVVQENRPYSEILTANYTMVSEITAFLMQTGLQPEPNSFIPAINRGQSISGDKSKPSNNWGLATEITQPHAGLLNQYAFLNRYPSTATNRNRARARWTLMNFLGFDIEASSPRIQDDDLQDINNPTLNNPNCTVCHNILDPIAGAFQNFGDEGFYRSGDFGKDALDDNYRKTHYYVEGDTWYADMLAPGFNDKAVIDTNTSLQWLAKEIVNDERFAIGTIKFWWLALFGEDVSSGINTTQNALQLDFIDHLADEFRVHLNLKKVFTALILSDWFRAQSKSDASISDSMLDIHSGGKRLLTPEELEAKTLSLTGLSGDYNQLHNQFLGGIDSLDSTIRQRTLSSTMYNTIKLNALSHACEITFNDFERNTSERLLFSAIEKNIAPGYLNQFEITPTISTTDYTTQSFSLNITQTTNDLTFKFNRIEGDLRLYGMSIKAPSGVILFDDQLFRLDPDKETPTAQPEWRFSHNTVTSNNDYRLNYQSRFVSVTLPHEQLTETGNYQITVTSRPQEESKASAALSVISENPQYTDLGSQKIRHQISTLYERLLGEKHNTDSTEIKAAFDFFLAVRNQQMLLSDGYDLIPSGTRCENVSEQFGYDRDYTLGAWKAMIAALMSDYHYIYE